jgi:nitrate reductase gamma subunit
LGLPKDYSHKIGDLKSAVSYSFIGGMNPLKKESAYLHFPTYTAGILYHIGTFVSAVLFFFFLFDISLTSSLQLVPGCILIASSISGIGIFLKRVFLKKLRFLSNPDDYISNLLVTMFQVLTFFMLFTETVSPFYFILTGLLFLYLPLGKLKHSIYFFAARYHLGYFYGWRGVWPAKKL